MKNRREQGFTLIELLIVIAIIGILAAVLIPNLLGARKRAYDTGAQVCAKSIQTAEAVYQIDRQTYTATITDLSDLSTACSASQITKSITSASGTDFTATVSDSRGSRTFTATASSLTGN